MPIYCQPIDEGRLAAMGFSNIHSIETEASFKGVQITRAEGQHGKGAVLKEMGAMSGFIFTSPEQPTVFWAGDSILCEDVLNTTDIFKPDVIITHSSGALWGTSNELIVMDSDQTLEICRHSPSSRIVAIHLDSFDYGTVTRNDLKKARDSAHIPPWHLLVPDDGEKLTFEKL